jgi:hypothetical protein
MELQTQTNDRKRPAEEIQPPGVCEDRKPQKKKPRKIVPLGTTCVLVGPRDIDVPESEKFSRGLHVVVEPGLFKTRPFVQAYRALNEDSTMLLPDALIDFSTVEFERDYFRMYFKSQAERDRVLRMWRDRWTREFRDRPDFLQSLHGIRHMAKLRKREG